MSCVSKHLTCNKDNDCGDFSDERYCNKTWSPCGSRTYLNIPNADIAGHGYDIIKEKERGSFLDNNRFNGRCYTVRSGDHNTLFRKPFNIQSYNFQVSASTSFHVKSYQSAKSFFQDERSSFKKSHNVGASYL
uniref:Uncharacterized protein n=1 Tax=Ciona savignyi TaxID=51511 RepID=H2YXX7_CIOSA